MITPKKVLQYYRYKRKGQFGGKVQFPPLTFRCYTFHNLKGTFSGFGETGVNPSSNQNNENLTLYEGLPLQGLSEAELTGDFFE